MKEVSVYKSIDKHHTSGQFYDSIEGILQLKPEMNSVFIAYQTLEAYLVHITELLSFGKILKL